MSIVVILALNLLFGLIDMDLSRSELLILYFALEGCIENLLKAGFSPDDFTLCIRIDLSHRLHEFLFHD